MCYDINGDITRLGANSFLSTTTLVYHFRHLKNGSMTHTDVVYISKVPLSYILVVSFENEIVSVWTDVLWYEFSPEYPIM